MANNCVVFVCNKGYFDRFIHSVNQLVTNGKYTGNICLVIGDDLLNDPLLNNDIIKNHKIIVKHFPDIKFTNEFMQVQSNLDRESHWIVRMFQYHKFHLFQTFFKQWDYIFYLDCGMNIISDISPMLNEVCENTLLAHSDAYDEYIWKLDTQYQKNNSYFDNMNNKYNLNIDYPQSTILLYDTKLITETTFNELVNLALEYPISLTNDQGIIALYFTNIKPLFKQIKTHSGDKFYYDFSPRHNRKIEDYIMLKRIPWW